MSGMFSWIHALESQGFTQELDGAGAMGLDTAFGAAHHGGGFSHVELFPVTQKEGLSLTLRQAHDGFFNVFQGLHPRKPLLGALDSGGIGVAGGDFQQVKIAQVIAVIKIIQVGKQGVSRLAAAKPVEHGVGQDSLKQQRQLLSWFVRVVATQLDHAVLHDVQRPFLVTHMVISPFEGFFSTLLRKSEMSVSEAKVLAAASCILFVKVGLETEIDPECQ